MTAAALRVGDPVTVRPSKFNSDGYSGDWFVIELAGKDIGVAKHPDADYAAVYFTPARICRRWVESMTGWTRSGRDGLSEAHLVRIDTRTWGICWHGGPCIVWLRASDNESDMAFADEVLAHSEITRQT